MVTPAYADTSFLFSLYVPQSHSARAVSFLGGIGNPPLLLTSFGRFELFNAIRLAVFRKQIKREMAAADLRAIESDIKAGVLVLTACDWAAAHARAMSLSAQHTARGGHRGMDVLHVAIAGSLGAAAFLSFDVNQRKLGAAEKLVVGP